jgi:hypothetical protein
MRLSTRRSTVVTLAAVFILLAGVAVWHLRRPAVASSLTGPMRLPPLPDHVTVEVLNPTAVAGAGRLGALLLRQAGLDVVYYGSADAARRTPLRSVILVRGGDTTGVGRALAVLRHADVVRAPDATRLVDLSVILGRDFTDNMGRTASGQ